MTSPDESLANPTSEPRTSVAGGRQGWPALARSASWGLLPLSFIVVMVLFYPFRYVFEFDPDEGINAIKSFLTLRGYPLYSQIWSDQPPVFNWVLTAWFRLFGQRIVVARVLVLAFSAILILAILLYLRKSWGALAAVCGFVLVVLLHQFARLSVSVMIGLPAITFAFLAVWTMILWESNRRPGWLALSSTLLGLAIFTKLFTIVLVPVLAFGLLLYLLRQFRHPRARRGAWIALLAWIAPLAGITAWMLLAVVRPENISQLIGVHLAAQDVPAFQDTLEVPTINAYLRLSIPLFVLALVGVYLVIRRGAWSALYFAGWAALGYLLLFFNRPTWAHQELLVTVPAAVLAAIGVAVPLETAWRRLQRPIRISAAWALPLIAVAAAGFLLSTRLPDFLNNLDPRLPNVDPPAGGPTPEAQLVALMGNHSEETHWVYSESPMFAFLARLPIPPPLAVMTQKRMRTGALTDDEVLAVLEEYKPELVLMSRFTNPGALEYMRIRNFRRIDSTLKYRLYFRPDAPESP